MDLTIVHNELSPTYHLLKKELSWCHTAYFAVSYANYRAFKLFKTELELFLRKNRKLRTVFDIESFVTDRDIIEEFATTPGDTECKVYIRPESVEDHYRAKRFHPKFYLFFDDRIYSAFIGSSNLTLGGMQNNIECNLAIKGKRNEVFFEDLRRYFESIWRIQYCLNVLDHSDLLDEYHALYTQHASAERTKARKVDILKRQLDKKAKEIYVAQKSSPNDLFAYFLGLVSANGRIHNRTLVISLTRQIANKGKSYEGFYYIPEVSNYRISQYEAHKRDVERIEEKIRELLIVYETDDKITVKHVKDYQFQIEISFSEGSSLFQELKKHARVEGKRGIVPFVPKEILASSDKKIIIAFLRGYCDLKSRISGSDSIYKTVKQRKIFSSLRLGISIPHRHPELLSKFASLFRKVGVEKGIALTNPEKRTREHLIRIDARYVPYQVLGTHWRRIFLNDFKKYSEKERRS